ncbi:hypothetical protein [Flexithrix dorotheae]|nr:hypothetical protein [Flexithrix dorotheae]
MLKLKVMPILLIQIGNYILRIAMTDAAIYQWKIKETLPQARRKV